MKRTNMFLPEQLLSRIRSLMADTGLSLAEIVRRAVDDYLVRLGK